MNEGMKIILERMDTNPEEFLDDSKWTMLIHRHLEYLSDEEQQAYKSKMNALKSERFTAEVMKELMRDTERDEDRPTVGSVRYNIKTNMAECYDGRNWVPKGGLVGGGGGITYVGNGGVTYVGGGGIGSGSLDPSMVIVKRKE